MRAGIAKVGCCQTGLKIQPFPMIRKPIAPHVTTALPFVDGATSATADMTAGGSAADQWRVWNGRSGWYRRTSACNLRGRIRDGRLRHDRRTPDDALQRTSSQSTRRGSRFAVSTPNTRASKMSSKSATHRTRNSIRATMSREMSQPANWHFAANTGCDQPKRQRCALTCGPTILRGFSLVRVKSCGFPHLTLMGF